MIGHRGFDLPDRGDYRKTDRKGRKNKKREKNNNRKNTSFAPQDAPVPLLRSMPVSNPIFNDSVLAGDERGGGHGDEEYLDPHGHHDVEPTYLWDWAKDNEGMDCLEQCNAMKAMNDDPHHISVFCYDTATHGWSPSNPDWEVRMELRCQEGHWANKMKGMRMARDDGGDERGGGHSHGGGGGGGKGDDGITAYGQDGNEWEYKPRWYYCNGRKYLI